MRILLIVFACVCVTVLISNSFVDADPPSVMSYQGYLTDTGGTPLDGQYQLRFKLYKQAIGGDSIWSETRMVDISKGNFNVLLGSISPLDHSYFQFTPLYLGIAVGGDPELSPRSELGSVGYSYRTGTVDGSQGGSVSGNLNLSGNLNVTGTTGLGGTITTPSGVTLQSVADTLKIISGSTAISIRPDGMIVLDGSSVSVVSQSTLDFSATSDVTIAGNNVSITATNNVDVSAGNNATVTAASQAKTQGNSVNVTASGTTDINGAMVQIN